jgi:RNA polymerase sigma-70 factor, ECF subfamily
MMIAVHPPAMQDARAGDPAPGLLSRYEPDDAATIAAVAAGDAAALDLLYVRFRPAAFATAYAVLRDPATAEDVVHDAFLSVWRNAASYRRERGAARAWLLTIVRNAAIDHLRSRRFLVQLQPTDEIDRYERPGRDRIAEDVASTVAATTDAHRVRAAVRTLPAAQRDAVELAFFAGLTHGEIAARTGLPLGTVKGRLRLGLRRLRKDLPDLAPGMPASPRAAAEPIPAWQ